MRKLFEKLTQALLDHGKIARALLQRVCQQVHDQHGLVCPVVVGAPATCSCKRKADQLQRLLHLTLPQQGAKYAPTCPTGLVENRNGRD